MTHSRYDDLSDEELIVEAIDFVAEQAELPTVMEARLKALGLLSLIQTKERT